MIGAFQSQEGYFFKIALDGHDFMSTELGCEAMNEAAVIYARRHCKVDAFPDAEAFISYCMKARRAAEPDHPLPIKLRDQYKIGLYTVPDKPDFGTDYCILNEDACDYWQDIATLRGLTFLVAPSYSLDGKVNEIGFRVLDTKTVHEAAKWIFMFGQQATYGLDRIQSPSSSIILVEGAWDQIAFEQAGVPNTVGLGAVKLTDGHRIQLAHHLEEASVCFDMDDFGKQQTMQFDHKFFFAPSGKDPFDAWTRHGHLRLVPIN